jgi:HTH domain in Mos1 transposase
MEKIELCPVIKFLPLEGQSSKDIHKCLVNVYQDSAPSHATAERWVAKFKCGHTSVEDEPHPGASKTATDDQNVKKFQELVIKD